MDKSNAENLFFPAETKCASQVVYEQIYEKIVSGKLKPGDRLPAERTLSDLFNRSRPVIREALRMLQQDGLIKIEVGSTGGAVIQSISIGTIEAPLQTLIDAGAIGFQELAEYRRVNDLGCAELAVRNCNEEDIEKLNRNLEKYKKAVNDSSLIHEIDVEFHKILAEATHNQLAISVNRVLSSSVISLYWGFAEKMKKADAINVNKEAYKTHRELVDAIAARDLEHATHCMHVIVDLFYSSIKPYLDE